MRSIRRQLLIWCSVAIALMLAILGMGLYLTMRHSLESQFDSSLAARATLLVNTLDWDPNRGFHFSSDFTPLADGRAPDTPRYFQIWTPDGKAILRPASLGKDQLKLLFPSRSAGTLADIKLPDDQDGRELVLRFHEGNGDEDQSHDRREQPRPIGDGHNDRVEIRAHSADIPRDYILAVARSTDELEEAVSSIGWSLVICCSLATVCSAALIAWLLQLGFRPVDSIAEQIAGVGTTHLQDRISTERVPRELFPIVDRLNKLLQRVEAAVLREKALTADMAHELRTPLAGLRTSAEVALTQSRSPEEYQRTLRQSLEISVQMQDMVENLLTLARLEARACNAAPKSLQLEQMLTEQLNLFSAGIISRHLTLDKSGVAAAKVSAPPDLMLLVIRNVLDNAISYVNESGTIRLTLDETADCVTLTVSNTGSAVSAQQAGQVFERFWRGDQARTDQGRHSGLGLSIVQNIMRQIGGAVSVESSVGGWFTISLKIPKHGGIGHHDS